MTGLVSGQTSLKRLAILLGEYVVKKQHLQPLKIEGVEKVAIKSIILTIYPILPFWL